MVKSVAIIGGGASGSIILDSLVQEKKFDKIKLFERRDKAGGVWVLDKKPSVLNIPPGLTQDELDPPVESPLKTQDAKEVLTTRTKQERYVHTASYERLRTNIPEQLMTYSDEKNWGIPKDDERRVDNGDYVHGTVIQEYISRYINRNPSNVVYNTTVEDLRKDYNVAGSQFELTLREETKEVDAEGRPLDRWYTESFDAVIVATGHYHVPFIPDVPGLKEVYHRFPHKVKHSKTFRTSDEFEDKRIVVVGTRASGADIVQIALTKDVREVYQSRRSPDTLLRTDSDDPRHHVLPKIVRYELIGNNEFNVHFDDGTIVKNPDEVIYATGFRYSYPFLKNQYPNFTTGYILPDLYQHTFLIKDPKLSVIGVPTDAISFRAFEYQSVLVSRFLAGKVKLPDSSEQLEWALQRYQNKGNSRAYHTIDFEGKFQYLEGLTKLGGGVDPIDGTGRPFPEFDESDHELQSKILERLKHFFAIGKEDKRTDEKDLDIKERVKVLTEELDGITIPV